MAEAYEVSYEDIEEWSGGLYPLVDVQYVGLKAGFDQRMAIVERAARVAALREAAESFSVMEIHTPTTASRRLTEWADEAEARHAD